MRGAPTAHMSKKYHASGGLLSYVGKKYAPSFGFFFLPAGALFSPTYGIGGSPVSTRSLKRSTSSAEPMASDVRWSMPELKGSIGEGPNHSNHSNHSNRSNSLKIGIFRIFLKKIQKFQKIIKLFKISTFSKLSAKLNSDKFHQDLS